MKKELAAAAVLLLLMAAALYNISYLKGFIGELTDTLEDSRAQCEAGDFVSAEELLRSAIDHWNASEGYTHILIRHSEVDSATDAFYELLSLVKARDAASADGAYEKLAAHLSSLYTMERVSIGSIF